MPGRRCVLIAAAVSGGMASLLTHSTGSPDIAAQAAAGMAYSGRSAEAITTSPAGEPAVAVCRRSTAAARAAGGAGAARRGQRRGGGGRHVRGLVARDGRPRADADDLRPAGLLAAGGLQRVER